MILRARLTKSETLRADLLEQIRSGTLRAGDRIMPEVQLCRKYRLSRTAVRMILEEFLAKGLIERVRGKGTFVLEPGHARQACKEADAHGLVFRVVVYSSRSHSLDHMHEARFSVGLDLLAGLTREAEALGIGIKLDFIGPAVQAPDDVHSYVGDGVLLLQGDPVHRRIAQLAEEAGVPFVMVHPMEREGFTHFVDCDDCAGALMATRHLLEQGRKRIALITADLANAHLYQRFMGYRRALRAAGLEFDRRLLVECGSGEAHGAQALRELIKREVRFDGIFCSTDLRALGVLNALRESGIRVPHDVSVVGMDNIPGSGMTEPPLTTVAVPREEMGASGVRLLMELATGSTGDGAGHIILKPELMVRESSVKMTA